MIMEIDISKYAFTAILLIIIKEKKVYLVTFYSCIFKTTKLNYNIHDKELLIVFKVFHTQHYYLKGLELLIDIIMNHKNLEYFLTTKIFSHYQAR